MWIVNFIRVYAGIGLIGAILGYYQGISTSEDDVTFHGCLLALLLCEGVAKLDQIAKSLEGIEQEGPPE